VLVVLVVAFGTALMGVPIGALRLVIGSLLLVFGLQWLRKGIGRVYRRRRGRPARVPDACSLIPAARIACSMGSSVPCLRRTS
jgi:hypothetical protein